MEDQSLIINGAICRYVYNDGVTRAQVVRDFDIVAQKGPVDIEDCPGCEITDVTDDCITIDCDGELLKLNREKGVGKNYYTCENGYKKLEKLLVFTWPYTKSDKKMLQISIGINALGIESGSCVRIPLTEFPEGKAVCINGYLGSIFHPYVSPIYITVNEHNMSIDSKYLRKTVSFAGSERSFFIHKIGLEYAWCDFSIYLI